MKRSNLGAWLLALGGASLTGAYFLLRSRSTLTADPSRSLRQAMVEEMYSLLGVPYIWGGKTPLKGLDCSGAINYVLFRLGLVSTAFVNSTNAHALYTMSKPTSLANAKAGDLVFYGTPTKVTHVMMLTGDGRVIGATGGDSTTKTVEIAKKQGAEVKILRSPMYRTDLLSVGSLPFVA